MAREIRAAVAREKGRPFRMEELTLDGPRSDEVLVEVSAVGVCHTDIAARDQWLPVPLPSVPGHEGAGVVIAMGSAVTKVAPVDRLITRYPLTEINQAVADTKAGRAVKAVLEPAGSRSG